MIWYRINIQAFFGGRLQSYIQVAVIMIYRVEPVYDVMKWTVSL
jgi:hypothetical protein